MKNSRPFPKTLIAIFSLTAFADGVEVFKANNSNSLNLTGSWTGAVVPTAADVAVWDTPYSSNPTLASTLGDNMTWQGIRVASPVTAPRIRNTAGKTLTLGTAGINMSAASQNFEVQSALAPGANQSWNITSGRTFTASALTGGGGLTVTKTGDGILGLTGTASNFAGGLVISGGSVQASNASGTQELSGSLSGSGPLTKSGAGALTLSGNNAAYGGTIDLTAGQLNLNHAAALGSSILSINGGVLDNTSGTPLTLSGTAAVAWNANFTFTGTSNLNLGATPVTLAGDRTVTVNGSTLGLGGLVSGNASLTKLGAGILETGTGATIEIQGKLAVNGGILRIGGGSLKAGITSGNLEIAGGAVELTGGELAVRSVTRPASSASFLFQGGTLKSLGDSATFVSGLDAARVGASGARFDSDGWILTVPQPLLHDPALGATADGGLLLKDGNGSGKLTLAGANTYTGPTVIESGTLLLGSGGSIASSPVIEVQASGVFDAQSGTTIASGQTLQGTGTVYGALTVGTGGNLSPAGSTIGTLTAMDSLSLAGNATFQINKTGASLTSDQVSGMLQVNYGGTLTVTATGSTLTAGNMFKLFDAVTYAGGFTSFNLPALSAGLFWETADLLVDGSIKVINTVPQPIFTPSGGACFDSQSVIITGVSGSIIHYTTDGSDPVTSPTRIDAPSPVTGVVVPLGTTAFTIRAYAGLTGFTNSITVTVEYDIVDTAIWTLPGSGNWSVGPNWFEGLVGEGQGIIADFSTVELSSTATATLDSSRVIGHLKFGSTNNLYDWNLQAVPGATLTLDAAPGQPVIQVNNRTASITAIMAGSMGFEKTGSGTLVLTGANTLTGGTRISGGTLRIGNGGTTGTLDTAAVENNGILEFNRSDTYTIPNDISGTGKIFVDVGNTITLSGQLSCGALRINGHGAHAVTLTGSAANAINAIEDEQDGHCTLVFAKPAGVNAFSGPLLDVGGGYASQFLLRLNNNEQIADTTVVKMYGWDNFYGGRAWFQLNGFNETIAGLTDGTSTSYVQNNAATPSVLTLAGSGTYSLRGAVQDGSTGTLGIVWSGTGSQTFSGNAIDYTGTTSVTNGRLILLNNDDTWTTMTTIASGAVVEIRRDNADTYEHRNAFTLSGAGTLEKTGNGTMDMNWDKGGTVAMASGGLIHVKEGTLRLGYGTMSNWTNNKGDLTVETGAIFDLWDNNTTTAGVVVDALSGGGSIARSTYGNTGNLTLGVDGGSGDFSGAISNATGIIHLVKQGAGTQILSGTNTYSGTTTVGGGTLLINNATGSGSGSGAVTANTGTTLGGAGSISGTVTVNAGATLAPGSNGAGTFATGPATLAGTYACQIDGANSDKLAVTGNLVLTGSTLAVSTVTAPTAGTYLIATYTGSLTGTFASVTSGYTVDYSTPNQVKLIVPIGSGYSSWVSGYGLTGNNALADADPDLDGIANSIEFVLGGNPATVQDQGLLPTISLVTNPGGGVPNGSYMKFSFRRTPASAYLNPDMQYDADLAGTWTAATGAPGAVRVVTPDFFTTPTPADKVDVYVPRSGNEVNGKLFGRLGVNVP